ncbi:MAG: hypothetical protein IKY98_00045 [Alphaproteobacteria bacterium]|nr:hypothetical protein [Alphaproteobacteria bacterium]
MDTSHQKQHDEALERQTRENRPDLRGARLERFLAEATNLRRNLGRRKQQQTQRKEKSCTHSK